MSMALQQEVAANSLENLQTDKLINSKDVEAKAAFDAITDSEETSLKDKLEDGTCTYEDLKNNQKEVVELWRDMKTPDKTINNIKNIIAEKRENYLKELKIPITFEKPFDLGIYNYDTIVLSQDHIHQPKDHQSLIVFPEGYINVFADPKDINFMIIKNGDIVESRDMMGSTEGKVFIEDETDIIIYKDDNNKYNNIKTLNDIDRRDILAYTSASTIVKKLD